MKPITILLPLCLFFFAAAAQKKQNVYFFKNNGKEVALKDSADYLRIIQEPDSGELHFNLFEFYVNDKRKTIGKVSSFQPFLVYEGLILRFDPEGKRKEVTTHEKGMPLGMSYHYFSNGKLNKQIEYLPYTSPNSTNLPKAPYNPNAKLIYFADSLGKVYVEGGNGHFLETTTTASGSHSEEGDYKDGVKHGVWKGSSNGSSFTETYDMGKLISGETTVNGLTYPYTKKESLPEFKGGISKFYEYVGRSVRYPAEAIRQRASGSVTVEFTVEKDGRVSDVVIKKSAHPDLDEEAMRVLRLSPKWIPATQRGIPVRVKYSIPLKFSMPR